TYRSRPVTSRESIQILVHSTDPIHPWIRLALSGAVRLQAYAQPRSLAFRITQHSPVEGKSIELRTHSGHEMKIEQILSSSERLSAQATRSQGTFRCLVTPSQKCPSGNWTD